MYQHKIGSINRTKDNRVSENGTNLALTLPGPVVTRRFRGINLHPSGHLAHAEFHRRLLIAWWRVILSAHRRELTVLGIRHQPNGTGFVDTCDGLNLT